jgi:hypothetical protein
MKKPGFCFLPTWFLASTKKPGFLPTGFLTDETRFFPNRVSGLAQISNNGDRLLEFL